MSFNNFDIYLMIGIAVVATFMRLYDFPMPPLILAFVLGGFNGGKFKKIFINKRWFVDFFMGQTSYRYNNRIYNSNCWLANL